MSNEKVESGVMKMINSCPNSCEPIGKDSFGFNWSAEGTGFGQTVIFYDKSDKKWKIDNEGKSREFIVEMFKTMIEDMELTYDRG